MMLVCFGFFFYQEDESGAVSQSTGLGSASSRSPAVVKTKASSVIMSSLITSMFQSVDDKDILFLSSVYFV